MDFLILGPLEVTASGRALELGAAKQRALLAVLLLRPNQAVSATRIIDELWGESPIASAAKVVQGYVSGLRKVLGADAIVTTAGGYLVRLDPQHLDSARFEALAAEGQACLQDDPARAGERLREALALWRGRPLEGIVLESVAASEAERLEELRLAVLEQRVEADLALGRDGLVGELQALVDAHPYRERMRAHLMLALYRSGRQAEALAAYRDTRTLLAEELGLEPSAELQRLERQMLMQAPELDAPERPSAAAPAPPPRREPGASARRLVSVVAATIAESSALAERLDPESLHGLLDRCSEICAAALERHGGEVERHLGDGVVAHLRAQRVARGRPTARRAGGAGDEGRRGGGRRRAGARSRGPRRAPARSRLGPGVRGRRRPPRDRGRRGRDRPGRAARAGRAARRDPARGARLRPARDVRARGAAEPAGRGGEGRRRPRLAPGGPGRRRADARARPRAALRRARARARRAAGRPGGGGRRPDVPPGHGRGRRGPRQVAPRARVRGRDRRRATVVVGRCLPYGDGLAYRPLAEMVRQLGGDVAALLEGDDRAGSVARLVSGAVGASDEPATVEETSWAIRRLFEGVARERPLVAVVEDVHWAPPTLLDLLEYLVAFSGGAPILLLCLARPELLDERPSWRAPQPRRSLVTLEALSDAEARELVAARAPDDDRGASDRIVTRAEGNPLFLEQLVAAGIDDGGAGLPPSLQAVLAARIDRLDPGQRALLSRASVEGRAFHVGALRELLPDDERPRLETTILGLVRAQLIEPEQPEFAGEDAFRFAHALIRDAAYEGTPKALRAELHERLAGWLEATPGALDEIVGYHLEQAYRWRAELAPPGERERALGARGARRLEAAARSALAARAGSGGRAPAGAGRPPAAR